MTANVLFRMDFFVQDKGEICFQSVAPGRCVVTPKHGMPLFLTADELRSLAFTAETSATLLEKHGTDVSLRKGAL